MTINISLNLLFSVIFNMRFFVLMHILLNTDATLLPREDKCTNYTLNKSICLVLHSQRAANACVDTEVTSGKCFTCVYVDCAILPLHMFFF